MRLVCDSDIELLDLRWGDTRVRISQEAYRTASSEAEVGSESDGATAITAPLTGVFYSRPAPELPNFVDVGGQVTPGQVVGLIETMKLFNEIVSELDGEIVSILVEDGDLVESGQALMHVIASAAEYQP